MKNPTENLKNKAEALNKNIKENAENLNKKIQEGSDMVNKNIKAPMEYNYLIFALPILLILLSFIPLFSGIVQIIRLVIFACIGYVLYFEYRTSKNRDKVFYISLALVILFNPVIPLFIPGASINIISIAAIAYLAYITQMSKGSENKNSSTHSHTKKDEK